MKSVPGVSWSLPRRAGLPSDAAAVAHFFGLSNWLILKIRVSGLDRARDATDLVAASVDASLGTVEYAILGKYLVYGRAPTRRIVFTEDVAKIADKQGR
jgi:hypothetical protein